MPKFRTASWSAEKMQSAREELDNIFREATGYGNGKRMNPRAADTIHANRYDIAQTVVKMIDEETANINMIPYLADEVTGDIRDNYMWQEIDGSLRVVDRAYGSKPLSQRLAFKEYGMKTSSKELAVEIPLEEVFSGRLTPSIAAREMAIAIQRYRTSMILDAVDAGIPSVNDRSGVSGYTLRYTCSGGALGQAAVDKAIDGLMDEGDSAAILGRHLALFPAMRSFTDGAGLSHTNLETQREVFTRGVIGQYHGASIVKLSDPLAKRRSKDHLIPTNKVWVTGSQKGAIMMTKPVDFLNWSEVSARDAVYGVGIRLEDGVLVWDPYRYRIITITP